MTLQIESAAVDALLSALRLQAYVGKDERGQDVSLTYAWPEITFDPDSVPRYLSVSVAFNNHGFQPLGEGALERMGFLQVMVVWVKGFGIIQPTDVAGKIALAWKKGTTVFGTGVKVKVDPAPWVANPVSDPSRVLIPVNIPWKAYTS